MGQVHGIIWLESIIKISAVTLMIERKQEEDNVSTKTCGKCRLVKPLTDFSTNKGKNDGYNHWCKICANTYNKERNRQLYTESFIRAKNLKQHYGITSAECQAMFLAQNGVCAACGQPERFHDPRTKQAKNLQVDHCHTTGKVRVLLCKECNNALGLLHDDPERVRQLLRYVKLYQSSQSEYQQAGVE